MSKSSSNIDVKYIKLNIATNIGQTLETDESQKKEDAQKINYQPLTSDMIHIPGEDLSYLKQQKNKYPCITDKFLYPYPVLQSKSMKELVDIFFNPLNFEKFLLENRLDGDVQKGGKKNDNKIDAILRYIEKSEGIFTTITSHRLIKKIDNVLVSDASQSFLNDNVENDSFITFIKDELNDRCNYLSKAIQKALEDEIDASDVLVGDANDQLGEAFNKKKDQIIEIFETFDASYEICLKTDTEDENIYLIDPSGSENLCKKLEVVKTLLEDDASYFTRPNYLDNEFLKRVNILSRLLENLNPIFETWCHILL